MHGGLWEIVVYFIFFKTELPTQKLENKTVSFHFFEGKITVFERKKQYPNKK